MHDDMSIEKRMAELLKSGATMLNDYCPDCKVPLFKLRSGDIICPSCNRKVIYVKEGEEFKVESMLILNDLKKTIIGKLQELKISIAIEKDIRTLLEQSELLIKLLDSLKKLEEIEKSMKG